MSHRISYGRVFEIKTDFPNLPVVVAWSWSPYLTRRPCTMARPVFLVRRLTRL